MEKAIHWIIDHLPKPLQKLWYDHESVWMYILMGGLTTVVSLVFKSETHTRAAFWREFYMFYGARLVTYFLEIAIMELGNHFFATVNGEIVTWRSLLVKILAQVVILVLNYIFSKLVIFKKKETAEKGTAE